MIIFAHVPKTAGSTFQFILENSFGWSHCHTNHTKTPVFRQTDLDFARKIFPGLRSIAGHNLVNPIALSARDPFLMTFLREPVARVFSHYQDNVLRGGSRMSFEEALRGNDQLENLHVKMLAGERNLEKAKQFLRRCGFVGLTEKFELSLHILHRLSPCPLNLNYKRKVVAKDNTIKKSLENDPQMVSLARAHNELDLELYAFAVNELFPGLCAKAGFKPTDQVSSFDRYTSELKPKFLLCRFYNLSIYRQICKLRTHRKAPNLSRAFL